MLQPYLHVNLWVHTHTQKQEDPMLHGCWTQWSWWLWLIWDASSRYFAILDNISLLFLLLSINHGMLCRWDASKVCQDLVPAGERWYSRRCNEEIMFKASKTLYKARKLCSEFWFWRKFWRIILSHPWKLLTLNGYFKWMILICRILDRILFLTLNTCIHKTISIHSRTCNLL